MTNDPILAGVVGSPIAHSLSPLIHGEWLRRAGINGRYDAIEIEPGYEPFKIGMDELRRRGFRGVNVTLPHKENALQYADAAAPVAKQAGAANTLIFEDASVKALNTDVSGFTTSLKQAGIELGEVKNSTVLGAGGAARGVVAALACSGRGAVTIFNRTKEKAEAIAALYENVTAQDWDRCPRALLKTDLLVNTTSLGMTSNPALEIDIADLPRSAAVADIVYAPLETSLLRAAKERGLKVVDGLDMLMHQAAPGFEAWFGSKPVIDNELRELLVTELERRKQ